MAVKPQPIHGVDISHHQSGALNLAAAKRNGLKWLYHKATEGDTFVDKNYAKRRIEAKAAGIPFGAYHFARAERGDATAEARRFISVAKPQPGDLRPALDLETLEGMTLGEVRIWAASFIAEVRRLTGHAPVVYTPFDLGDAAKGCLIWRPRYNNDNRPPVLRWDIWQFSNGQFGVPRFAPGIGNVDLNVMRPGLTVAEMQIPKPAPKPDPAPPKPGKKPVRVHMTHVSMQFSDTPAQQASDANRVFARAKKRRVRWLFGTEAQVPALRAALRKAAEANGYTYVQRGGDVWVAVANWAKVGKIDSEFEKVIDGKAGKYPDRGVLRATFTATDGLGKVTLLASHYNTKKSTPVSAQHNRALARQAADFAKRYGAGKALVFYGGDQNIVDRTHDTFFGEPLTSAWDETKRWWNTGHDNIDVIASYDRDGRVKAAYIRSVRDKWFKLFTDHFLVEAGYDVIPL